MRFVLSAIATCIVAVDAFQAVPARLAKQPMGVCASNEPRQATRVHQISLSGSEEPDTFVPVFVAVAFGGYALIVLLDYATNGFCAPWLNGCVQGW